MTEPVKFQDLTPEDFGEAPKLKAGTNPATNQPWTGQEISNEVLGTSAASEIEPNPLKRGLAGAGMALKNKWLGLTGQPAAEDYGLSQDFAGGIGSLVPDMVGSMAVPAQVLPQATYGALTRMIEPAPNEMERGINALKGAAEFGGGQMLASGLVRGVNSARGNLTREGQVASAAGRQVPGLELTAGDIANSKLLRLAEEKSFGSPSAGQTSQVATMMADVKNNPLSNAVMNAYDAAQGKVTSAATRLDDLVAQGGLPNVAPRETQAMLRAIAQRSPKTLDAIGDPVLRQRVDNIITAPSGRIPKSMTFTELDELRRAFGPIMSKIEMQSKSGASNINTADSNRWKQLYKGIMTDIENWGSGKASADALAAHKELSSTFKNEVLPLREHPVAGKIIGDTYTRPEDIVRDLALSPRNASINKQLYERLDQGGKNALDAFRMAQRGSREFVHGESKTDWAKPLALSAGLTAPAWAPAFGSALPWVAGGLAAEQALVHGINSRVGRAVLSGAPEASRNPWANAAVQSGLRTALPRGALSLMSDE